MIYLLIDSCSWDDLMKEPESSLEFLENLCNSDSIKMVTTTDVLREWKQGKDIVKNRTFDSLKNKYRVANEINKKELLGFKYDLENIDNPSEKILERFEILMKSGLILEPTEKLKAYCTDRAILRKAPFHRNQISMSDALIIYCFLEYFKARPDVKLWFVSKNFKDFSKSKKEEFEIHPDIIEDYPDLDFNYYWQINKAIHELKQIFPIGIQLAVSSSLKNDNEDEISIDSELPILEKIYQYFKKRFREFEFVPNHILLKNSPFKFNPLTSYPYYSNYSLHLKDLEIYGLFKKIGSEKERELKENEYFFENENQTEKAKFILKTLTNNLIFFVTHEKSRGNYINVGFVDTPKCNCHKCLIQRLEYKSFFQSLNKIKYSIEDEMEHAYSMYLIGNYAESAQYFIKALKKAEAEKKYGLIFIIEFNLKKLKNFIRYNFYGRRSFPEILQIIDEIKLEKALISPYFKEHREIIDWIFKEKFYSSAKNKLISNTGKIIDQYHSALKGGRSMNSTISNSISEFQELTYFLHKNRIIYNRFTEFYQLSEVFFEGIIASYGIRRKGNTRLTGFNDWLLNALVSFGNSEHLVKVFRRYDVNHFKLELNNNLEQSFNTLVSNFVWFESSFDVEVNKYCSDNGKVFKNIVDDKLSNILVILAYGDFERKFIEDFAQGLIELIKIESFVNWHKLKYLNIFISKKGKYIRAKTLKKMFKLMLVTPKFHEEQILESISEILKVRNLSILLNKKEFDILSRFSFKKCEICERIHSAELLISSTRVLSEIQKNHIENLIHDSLLDEFDFDLFYLASIYEVIDFSELYFEKAIESCVPNSLAKTRHSIFGDEEDIYLHQPLNRFLNLCFQRGINLKEKRFEKILKVDEYYKWLILMDDFDYSKFKPIWITEFVTKYYFQRIAASIKTKKFIKDFIKNSNDVSIEKTYLNIFIRRKWDS